MMGDETRVMMATKFSKEGMALMYVYTPVVVMRQLDAAGNLAITTGL